MNRRRCLGMAGGVWLVGFLAGCGGGITIELPDGSDATIQIPDLDPTVVKVEVWNDTDYEVAPRIKFDDETGFWGRLFSSSSELNTGILAPGEFPDAYRLACDRVGVIQSDSAGQFFFNETIGQADDTRLLKVGEDFDCGDTIRFHFVGEGDGFGVNVYVNGRLVN